MCTHTHTHKKRERLYTYAKLQFGDGTQVLLCWRYVQSGGTFCSVECVPATDYVCNKSWLVGTKPLSTGTPVITLPRGFSVLPLNKTLYLEEATNICRIHNKLLTQPVLHKFCLSICIMTLKNVTLPQNCPVQAPLSATITLLAWLVQGNLSLCLLKHHTIKMYRGMELQLYTILILALRTRLVSVSCPATSPPSNKPPSYPLDSKQFGDKQCSCPCQEFNPLIPNDPYRCHTAPLTSKRCILYIYSTNIGTEYFKHGIYSLFFSSSKCSLFHNSNVLGFCIIHILYTGVLKL